LKPDDVVSRWSRLPSGRMTYRRVPSPVVRAKAIVDPFGDHAGVSSAGPPTDPHSVVSGMFVFDPTPWM
jgi:hypothetical protein